MSEDDHLKQIQDHVGQQSKPESSKHMNDYKTYSDYFVAHDLSSDPFDYNLLKIFEGNNWEVASFRGEKFIDLDKKIEWLHEFKKKNLLTSLKKPEKKSLKNIYHQNLCDLLMNDLGYKQVEAKPLGEGSFGVVLKAVNIDSLEVAVKVQYSFHIDLFSNKILDNLLNENKNLNIPSLFDNLKINKTVNSLIFFTNRYYVSCIETEIGRSLRDLIQEKIKDGKSFTFEEKNHICQDLIEHLFVLHSRGKAHLDKKPANVIYYYHLQKYLFIDFGIMETFKPKINNKSNLYSENLYFRGTKFYASPLMIEALNGNKAVLQDPFSNDIYSLGVTLLEVHIAPEKLTKDTLKIYCENIPFFAFSSRDFEVLKNVLITGKKKTREGCKLCYG